MQLTWEKGGCPIKGIQLQTGRNWLPVTGDQHDCVPIT